MQGEGALSLLDKVLRVAGYAERPEVVVNVYLWGSRLFNCAVAITLFSTNFRLTFALTEE